MQMMIQNYESQTAFSNAMFVKIAKNSYFDSFHVHGNTQICYGNTDHLRLIVK